MAAPLIETPRLRLRPCGPAQIEAACRMIGGDPDVLRTLPGDPAGGEDLPALLAGWPGEWARRGFGLWLVEERAAGRLAGVCGFCPHPGSGEPELAYAIIRPCRGRGYATEAAAAALRWALDEAGLARVVATALSSNAASRRVLEKIGMVETPGAGADDPLAYYAIAGRAAAGGRSF